MKSQIRRGLGRFADDRGGNFAMIAAVAAVPLVMAAGLALDVSTISRTKTELQQAMDAAVLAVAREGDKISDSEAKAIAETFLAGNLNPAYTDLEIVRDGTSVTLEADTQAGMAFGGLFGYQDWPVHAASSADIAYNRYEIALVLDTTGSMAGGKLKAMKDAVLGLIDGMEQQVDDKDKLKFTLVPFSTFVNVGPHHGPSFDRKGKIIKGTGADWLDIEGKSDIPQLELKPNISRFEVYHRLGKDWSGCVETREPSKKGEHDVADTPAVKSDKASFFVPAFAIDEPAGRGYRNDYIDSDVHPLDDEPEDQVKKLLKYGLADLLDQVGLGGVLGGLGLGGLLGLDPDPDFRHGKGPGRGCDAQPITPLTNDYEALKKKVKSLQAKGNTNILEGVAWGMRALSPDEPFAEGRVKEPGLEKIMIVLTDGANVFGNNGTELGSSYSSFGYLVDGRLGVTGGSASVTNDLMNEKTEAACKNAKDAGMELYTIRLEEPDVETGTMLKECASSPLHYFDTPTRSELDEVFDKIKDGIVRLRISS